MLGSSEDWFYYRKLIVVSAHTTVASMLQEIVLRSTVNWFKFNVENNSWLARTIITGKCIANWKLVKF